MVLKRSGRVNSLIFAKERPTTAIIWEAFGIAAAVCLWKVMWGSTMMLRSFSSTVASSRVPPRLYLMIAF